MDEDLDLFWDYKDWGRLNCGWSTNDVGPSIMALMAVDDNRNHMFVVVWGKQWTETS